MAIIKNYKAPEKRGAYSAEIDALIDAGPDAAFQIVAPSEATEGVRGGTAATEKVKFQNAARKAGYTARAVETEVMGDGNTRIVFQLTTLRVHEKGGKTEK